jgi:hypothetical protein
VFLTRFVAIPAAVVSACLVTSPAHADPAPPTSGFALEGRLSQSIAPVGIGLSAGTLLPSIVGGPPPASIGYRGDGWAVSVGPSIGHIGADTSATTSGSVWYFGAAVLGEIRVARSADRRTEGYVLVGANVAGATTSSSTTVSGTTTSDGGGDNGVSGKPAYGFLAGFGLRHWLAPNLGIGAELGESYVNVPLGTDTETVVSGSGVQNDQTSDLRANILSTFGDINVALTF